MSLSVLKKIMHSDMMRRYGTLGAFACLVIVFSLLSKSFLTISNAVTVLQQTALLAIAGCGMTMVMIMGRIDLSLGQAISALGVVAAIMSVAGWPMWAILVVSLLVGVFLGYINGMIITKLNIPEFIATLASGYLITGINQAFTKGYPVSGLPKSFYVFGQGRCMGIPVAVIVMIAILIVTWFVLEQTWLGRYVYAIGGNEEAAAMSGINVHQMVLTGYIANGIAAAITAIVLTSRMGSAHPLAGDNMTLDTIAAVSVGATAFRDGIPNLAGTFLGTLIIGTLNNGLTILSVPYYYQYIAKGLIIILAVAISSLQRLETK